MSPADQFRAISARNGLFSAVADECDGKGQSGSEIVDFCLGAIPSCELLCPDTVDFPSHPALQPNSDCGVANSLVRIE